MKKLAVVVGARPQFIKLAAISPELRKFFHVVIIHTGQHYDPLLSGNFFKELAIPEPDYNLETGSGAALKQIGQMLIRFDDLIPEIKPDALLVFGDTNSTAAGAISASKHRIPLIHVEAGMREFNKWIPEESNKLITTVLSDFHFCATPTAVKNLSDMGIQNRVWLVGDVMIDLLYRFKHEIELSFDSVRARYNLAPGDYTFVTMHRDANRNNPQRLKALFGALAKIEHTVVFTLHPGSRSALEKSGWLTSLSQSNLILCEPLPYLQTQAMIKHAAQVITDSGGITKEAWAHGVRAIIVESQTEWIESLEGNANVLATTEKEILAAIRLPYPGNEGAGILGNGQASVKLAEILHEFV